MEKSQKVDQNNFSGRIENIDGRPVKWLSHTDKPIRVYGLPWLTENDGKLFRLPVRIKDAVPEDVWGEGEKPSGGRLRFASDTSSLMIRLQHGTRGPKAYTFGNSGIDLYVEEYGKQYYWGTSVPKDDRSTYIHIYFEKVEKKVREFTLYLPLFRDVLSLEVGFDPDAFIYDPRTYRLSKPVVFYGSSITQGGNASRPGNVFVTIIGRDLDLDIVNLGCNGCGRGEPIMAELMAEVDASCYVLDFYGNIPTVEGLRAVYAPFYRRLRESHLKTPILMVSPICFARTRFDNTARLLRSGRHQVILDAYKEAVSSGDPYVYFQDGSQLIDEESEGVFVDGNHPNDKGFYQMAEGLKTALKTILKLN